MAYENECLRDQFNMRQRGFAAFLKELNIAPMHFFFDKKNHEFGNQTIEMHRFASENQIYTGTVTFGVEPFKSLKGQGNLLLKNLTCVENVRFFVMGKIFCRKVRYSKHQRDYS